MQTSDYIIVIEIVKYIQSAYAAFRLTFNEKLVSIYLNIYFSNQIHKHGNKRHNYTARYF